jgi:hypothetical protein
VAVLRTAGINAHEKTVINHEIHQILERKKESSRKPEGLFSDLAAGAIPSKLQPAGLRF